ncbi:MAG: hypothetical protein ACRD8W_01955 [Nitrososphaeraceae archaeon]
MDSRKLTYSRTIETEPEQAELLNHLVDRYVVPVLEKRVAQAGLENRREKKMSPEEQLEAVLNFGHSGPIKRVSTTTATKKIAQAGLNSKELHNLERILELGVNRKK